MKQLLGKLKAVGVSVGDGVSGDMYKTKEQTVKTAVRLPAGVRFSCGMMGAVIAGAFTHPVDVVKVRLQLAHGGRAVSTIRNLVHTEGYSALMRGLTGNVLRQASFVGVKFGTYDSLKSVFGDEHGVLDFKGKIGAGMVAGAAGALIGNPADLVMVRMQADGLLPVALRRNYGNALSAMKRVVQEEGVAALWRGSLPTLNRAVIVTASQMAIYDQSKEEIIHKTPLKDGPLVHLIASFLAAMVASFTSNPFDVAKTRLMQMKADEVTGRMPFKGTADCMTKTVKDEGCFALYKGVVPTICRQLPLNVIRFMAIEQLRKLCVYVYSN